MMFELEVWDEALYDHLRKGLAVNCAALNRRSLAELVGKSHNLIKSRCNIDDDRMITSTIL